MNRKSDLTLAQAQDLARHFLGPEYVATSPRFPDARVVCRLIWHDPAGGPFHYHDAPTWRAVFRLAGVKLPVRPQFVAVKDRIMRYTNCVGVMASPTFAARTANALNEYEPDRHGL
jgi:hypothetical protein